MLPEKLKDILKSLPEFKDIFEIKTETPTVQVYEPKDLKSKFEVNGVKFGKGKVGEKTDVDGVIFEIKGTDKKTVKLFTPDDEDALYNDQGKKVKLDETSGNVLEPKEGEENKLSNSGLLMEALLRNNVAPKIINAKIESIEVKEIKDDSVKIAKQETDKEDVQLEVKRAIAKIKNKNNQYVYFDLFTLRKTDTAGKFIGDKIKAEEVGRRFVSFGEGDKTKVYDISVFSLAERTNAIHKILLGEKSYYNKLLKINANAGLEILAFIYGIDQAKKIVDGFERFARDYKLFDEKGKLRIEEAEKLFGKKFFIRTDTGYAAVGIGSLAGLSAGALAVLAFSGIIVFPFATPASIAILASLGGVSATGWTMFIADAIRTAINRSNYIDKENLDLIKKVNKESRNILSKITKQQKEPGKSENEKKEKGEPIKG